jgi:hypothetical protein
MLEYLCDATPNAMLNAEGIYMLFRLGWQNEQLWLHVDLAEASDAAGELEECLDAFEDAHVCEADFLSMMLVNGYS